MEIGRELIEPLMRAERWQESDGDATTRDMPEEIASLCRKPLLESRIIDIARLTEITADDIIDRFLHADNLRIVAEEGDTAEEIVTEAALDDDDDLASEELAEIYLAQGLKDMAKETYRKLSLLNPEKSVYFAELIAKIDNN